MWVKSNDGPGIAVVKPKAIPWEDVESSNIKCIRYDPVTKYLDIQFKDKEVRVYRYMNVPEQFYKRFKEAESIGKYYYKNIKGRFNSIKLEEEQKCLKRDQ